MSSKTTLVSRSPRVLLVLGALSINSANAADGNPAADWTGSYWANGQCYCTENLPQRLGNTIIPTPVGGKTVAQVCQKIGRGPGLSWDGESFNYPAYRDAQCGNGPFAAADAPQPDCAGTLNPASGDCQAASDGWNLAALYGSAADEPARLADSSDTDDLADWQLQAPKLGAADPSAPVVERASVGGDDGKALKATVVRSASTAARDIDVSRRQSAASGEDQSIPNDFAGRVLTIGGQRYLQARDGLPAVGGKAGSRILVDGLVFLKDDGSIDTVDLYRGRAAANKATASAADGKSDAVPGSGQTVKRAAAEAVRPRLEQQTEWEVKSVRTEKGVDMTADETAAATAENARDLSTAAATAENARDLSTAAATAENARNLSTASAMSEMKAAVDAESAEAALETADASVDMAEATDEVSGQIRTPVEEAGEITDLAMTPTEVTDEITEQVRTPVEEASEITDLARTPTEETDEISEQADALVDEADENVEQAVASSDETDELIEQATADVLAEQAEASTELADTDDVSSADRQAADAVVAATRAGEEEAASTAVKASSLSTALRLPEGVRPSSREFTYVEALPTAYDVGGGGLQVEGSTSLSDRFLMVGRVGIASDYEEFLLASGFYLTPANASRLAVVMLAGFEYGNFQIRDAQLDDGAIDYDDSGFFAGLSSRLVLNPRFELQGGVGYSSFFEGDAFATGSAFYHINRQLDFVTRFELGDNDSFGLGLRFYY